MGCCFLDDSSNCHDKKLAICLDIAYIFSCLGRISRGIPYPASNKICNVGLDVDGDGIIDGFVDAGDRVDGRRSSSSAVAADDDDIFDSFQLKSIFFVNTISISSCVPLVVDRWIQYYQMAYHRCGWMHVDAISSALHHRPVSR